jgi:chemotaxis regulatin CheY-phosphate phosphatase CheZ
MKQDKTIEQAAQELREARSRYDELHRASEAARSREMDALSTLNRAQKAFDEAVEAVMKDAPRNSDWHSRTPRGESAKCP